MKLLILIFFLTPACGLAQQAQIGDPLKSEYVLGAPYTNSRLFKTDETATGRSVVCDIGQAIPKSEREGWYENQPIDGVQFQLLPKLVKKAEGDLKSAIIYDSVLLLDVGGDRTHGFAIIVKNEDILAKLQPRRGDIFVTWANEGSDITVGDGGGFATIDMIVGNGLYYKAENSNPDYFLSNCRSSWIEGLPVYKYYFDEQ